MKDINYKLIKDYILGKCSDKELSLLHEWLKEAPENEDALFRAEHLYRQGKGRRPLSEKALDKAEAGLFSEIHRYEAHRTTTRHLSILRYAAIGLLVLIGGTIALWNYYSRPEMIQVTASATKVMELTLPDSTKVWLNKNGTISYPEAFGDGERRVELSGEALFSVSKNPDRPFIVSSRGVSTRVLGTVFNFNTHCKDNQEEVSLLEGRLEITGNHGEGKIVIQPNQKAVIDKTRHTIEVMNVYAPLDAVWHDGMIPFRNMSIRDIAHVLEGLYGVSIDITAGIDRRSTYSGYIRHNLTIDSVLSSLSYSIPFTYKRKGSDITLYGMPKETVVQSCP
ncbi:FecR family protein [Prevotella sp. KH2C16]|uniref:FecR family protein n=1 Tax=Prevotella sp. KH2C16 TaxID=1855325 RepID=UPI0008F21C57|nr:FecR family protein [Prevotella sp. KH2C16]SFF90828.1 ferric-dicitrate binding protein FerR, regulates iron transport through sigma-19 [Prevotella sp. KH2C16]